MEIEVINGVEWRRKRYSNGQLMHEIPYVKGKLHGLVRGWRDNGQLRYEHPYVNGKFHGLVRWWHENGQLRHEDPYVKGQRHGLVREWHPDRQLWRVQLWNNDRLVFVIHNPPQTSGIWKLK